MSNEKPPRGAMKMVRNKLNQLYDFAATCQPEDVGFAKNWIAAGENYLNNRHLRADPLGHAAVFLFERLRIH